MSRFFPATRPTILVTPGYAQAPVNGLIELRPTLQYCAGYTYDALFGENWTTQFCELDSFQEDLVEYCWVEFTEGSK